MPYNYKIAPIHSAEAKVFANWVALREDVTSLVPLIYLEYYLSSEIARRTERSEYDLNDLYMYTDIHCHLNLKDYGSVDELIQSCLNSGVDRIVTVGFDVPSSEMCKNIAEWYDQVYFTAGLHPTELARCSFSDLQRIEELCAHPKCIGIGEIGLDYHYPDTDKERQHQFFKAQLELASKLKMPVQIHSRDCAEDTLNFLKDNRALLANGFLLHCYSYSPEMVGDFLSLGAYFSFGGTSTYKRSKKPRRAIAAIPVDRLLTETDSPYLSPSSAFGQFPNTPRSIPEITRNMAEIKGIGEREMCYVVRDNAERLFPKLKNESANKI